MSAQPSPLITEQEYLAGERIADVKHEYVNGRVYAHAGASRNHNILVANLVASFIIALRERNCHVFPSDMRVAVPIKRSYFYPDVTIICGDEWYSDQHSDTLINPTLLIEVISSSTEAYDRGMKSQYYRHIPSLREYLLVTQHQVHIEHYIRQPKDWRLIDYRERTDMIELHSIGCVISVADIYAKLDLPNAQPEWSDE